MMARAESLLYCLWAILAYHQRCPQTTGGDHGKIDPFRASDDAEIDFEVTDEIW